MKTSELFEKELGYIENDILREITKRTLDEASECIQTIPASATGKYHPTYALGEGGLTRHVKAAVNIAHSIMQTEIFDMFKQGQWEDSFYSDIVYAALILHDSQKPDETEKHNTRFDHPVVASGVFMKIAKEYLLMEVGGTDDEQMKEMILTTAHCIAKHMGQWATSAYTDFELPKPTSNLEWFVHLCDYLASRRFLEFNFEAFAEVGR